MSGGDVKELLDIALMKTGLNKVHVKIKPRLLSDNGPCYWSHQFRDYLATHGISHTRGAPYHPMTQGKIERYHRSIKNVVKLENYYLPGELEKAIGEFAQCYNHHRYHESLDNVTPADVYFGSRKTILTKRGIIKNQTLKQRSKQTQLIMNPKNNHCSLKMYLLFLGIKSPNCSEDIQSNLYLIMLCSLLLYIQVCSFKASIKNISFIYNLFILSSPKKLLHRPCHFTHPFTSTLDFPYPLLLL